MQDLDITQQKIKGASANDQKGPVGNKLSNLFIGSPIVPIHHVIAESFFKNAEKGILSCMKNNNINFNRAGLYELDRSKLLQICDTMTKINAVYLTFTFVEINPKDERLQAMSASHENMVYMIASLQTKGERTIEGHNYFIVNSKDDLAIDSLRITDEELEKARSVFQCSGHKVWNTYFKKENTRTVSYHISDLINTLTVDHNEKYTVHLCEISNVKKVIAENNIQNEVNEEVYNEFFKSRERQVTLVFTTGKDYYDMGSLRP